MKHQMLLHFITLLTAIQTGISKRDISLNHENKVALSDHRKRTLPPATTIDENKQLSRLISSVSKRMDMLVFEKAKIHHNHYNPLDERDQQKQCAVETQMIQKNIEYNMSALEGFTEEEMISKCHLNFLPPPSVECDLTTLPTFQEANQQCKNEGGTNVIIQVSISGDNCTAVPHPAQFLRLSIPQCFGASCDLDMMMMYYSNSDLEIPERFINTTDCNVELKEVTSIEKNVRNGNHNHNRNQCSIETQSLFDRGMYDNLIHEVEGIITEEETDCWVEDELGFTSMSETIMNNTINCDLWTSDLGQEIEGQCALTEEGMANGTRIVVTGSCDIIPSGTNALVLFLPMCFGKSCQPTDDSSRSSSDTATSTTATHNNSVDPSLMEEFLAAAFPTALGCSVQWGDGDIFAAGANRDEGNGNDTPQEPAANMSSGTPVGLRIFLPLGVVIGVSLLSLFAIEAHNRRKIRRNTIRTRLEIPEEVDTI